MATTYSSLLFGKRALWTPLHQLTRSLARHEQKVVFDSILGDLTRKYLSDSQVLPIDTQEPTFILKIAGAAALISGLVEHNEYMLECAIDWVSTSNGTQGKDIATKRALVCALASSKSKSGRSVDGRADRYRKLGTYLAKIPNFILRQITNPIRTHNTTRA